MKTFLKRTLSCLLIFVCLLVCVAVKQVVSAEEVYSLVTDPTSLKEGDKVVIVASEYNYALSTTQNNNNRGQAEVTKDNDTITFGDDAQVLTLEKGTVDGTFAFNTGSGYLYAASSSSNYLRTDTTLSDNSSWVITINEGVATIVAQGTNTRNTMQYNSTSSLFACYAAASQKAVCIYKEIATIEEALVFTIVEDSVQLRFGTQVPVEVYESLLADGYTFGVNFLSGSNNKDVACTNIEKVTINEEEYYQFSVVIMAIPVEAFTEEFTATCYASLNGEKVSMNSKTHSVITLLEAYEEMANSSENYANLDANLMAGLLTAANSTN